MRHSDQMERGSNLPAGTLTFLFSDIERSTRHLQEFGPAWSGALEDHHRLMREAIAEHAGTEVDTAGDSFLAVFATAPDAVRAALALKSAQADRRTDLPLQDDHHPQGQAASADPHRAPVADGEHAGTRRTTSMPGMTPTSFVVSSGSSPC